MIKIRVVLEISGFSGGSFCKRDLQPRPERWFP